MVKSFLKKSGLALITILLVQAVAYGSEPNSPSEASFKSRCAPENTKDLGFPPCADSPSECESGSPEESPCRNTPFNCLFLQEPIGGKPGYDLFKVSCSPNPNAGAKGDSKEQAEQKAKANKCPSKTVLCETTLWYGEAIVGDDQGPFQAILAYEEGKETQGPFGIVYNYLGLVYNFLSGLIVAFVVLVAIIGGIRMSTSAGSDKYTEGKNMIIKALVGMILWFTASVILYTINPTFFTF
ncbi:pilin [Patescibacteria group bacterium]|nr:pilin [Patescibacteria group bacterium]MBU1016347.1 pilin [Patescibacteria group bacterium]MBU1685050.1 pilin [Patescibacteria group bacterium]MBU1938858.1 pilin [Patescibacteria group bacterium]